jgi:hypothetical protein
MKAFQRFLIALILVGLGAAYFLWPYFEIRRFAAAVNKKDMETVKEMIDADDLRASLRKMIVDGLVLIETEKAGGTADPAAARQKIEAFTESSQGKSMLDQAMSGDALATMLTSNVKDGKQAQMTWRNEQWTSPLAFRVQDTESAGYLQMKLKGLKWKVTGLEVPAEDLRNFVMKQGRLPAGSLQR